MTDARAAKRYARALFQAAQKEGVVAVVDEDLKSLTQALHTSDAFRKYIFDPTVSASDKTAFFDKTLSSQINPLTLGLIKLAATKGRDNELFAIQLEFSELRRRHDKVVKAVIESALELGDDQKTAVVNKVSSLTGLSVEPEFKVDPSLLGGVKVTYDNMVLDGTARGHLNRLREALLRDALKQA